MADFETKDSGKRLALTNGMVRDVEDGKTDYSLVFSGVMLERWAGLLTRGAVKYGSDNWLRATVSTDLEGREAVKARFKRSLLRHMVQWLRGDTDEDHAAAIIFNVNGYETMVATTPLDLEAPLETPLDIQELVKAFKVDPPSSDSILIAARNRNGDFDIEDYVPALPREGVPGMLDSDVERMRATEKRLQTMPLNTVSMPSLEGHADPAARRNH